MSVTNHRYSNWPSVNFKCRAQQLELLCYQTVFKFYLPLSVHFTQCLISESAVPFILHSRTR
jgi:hypothetical protein